VSASPTLSWEYRICDRCGNEAELLSDRLATERDIPALKGCVGPVVHVFFLLCMNCGRPRLVLAADTGEWYVPGGGD